MSLDLRRQLPGNRVFGKLLPLLAPLLAFQPAAAQDPSLLATPAVEIATITGEMLGQAASCKLAANRLDKLEARIKAAVERAAANKNDFAYALTRFAEEKASGADRQRRNQTGIKCDIVGKSIAELERRRF